MKPTDYLKSVGVNIFTKGHNSYKLSTPGMMDLTVESWQSGGSTMVSMCHYGEQNGDLMKDPDILFEVRGDDSLVYREFQNDYTGYYSEEDAKTRDFMENTWVPNLVAQGHRLVESEMEN